jgi:hypothetical protein
MLVDTVALLKGFRLKPPADGRAVQEFQRVTNIRLPDDYLQFLRQGNGGEGVIGENSYLMLWGIEDLWRLNREYEVQEYAPGLLLIGSNGGGEAFAYDTRESRWSLVQVPFVGMDLTAVEVIADSFRSFLEALYAAD